MELGLFFALLAIFLVELLLSATWNRFYFRVGLPLYSREEVVLGPPAVLPRPERLEERLCGGTFPSFVFREIGSDSFAFRERAWDGFFRIRYTALMRGRLIFDRSRGSVRVVGLLNWTPLAFFGVFAFFVLSWSDAACPALLLFPVGIMAVLYVIQARRFRQVLAAAVAEWSGEMS